jgi:hypothetical protein
LTVPPRPIERFLAELRIGLISMSWWRRRGLLAEVRTHLEDAAADTRAAGADPQEAERLAVAGFGSAEYFAAAYKPGKRSRCRVLGGVGLAMGACVAALVLVFVVGGGSSQAPLLVAYTHYQGPAAAEQGDSLWIAGSDGTQRLLARYKGYLVRAPTVSPDGSKVAFLTKQLGDQGVDTWTLRVIQTSGGTGHTLVSNWFLVSYPRWSPDGTLIAFNGSPRCHHCYSIRTTSIYTVVAKGGAITQLTPRQPRVEDILPTWSPDGRRILYTEITGRLQARVVDVSTHESQPLFDSGDRHDRTTWLSFWQPHGNNIAYLASDPRLPGREGVFLTNIATPNRSTLLRAFPGGTELDGWSPSGRYLLLGAIPPDPKPYLLPPTLPDTRCRHYYVYDSQTHRTHAIACGLQAQWAAPSDQVQYSTYAYRTNDPYRQFVTPRRITTTTPTGHRLKVYTRQAASDSFTTYG